MNGMRLGVTEEGAAPRSACDGAARAAQKHGQNRERTLRPAEHFADAPNWA
jgi:hypothetical protein